MKKWTSIKDKKPQDGVMKLMCNMNAKEVRNSIYVGWFAGGVEVSQSNDKKATHWMDLPDFPSLESDK